MVWVIQNCIPMSWLLEELGWRRVVLSQRVWKRCVEIPEGVQGQSEGMRLCDVLVFLHGTMRRALDLPRPCANRVEFFTSVVNDDRDAVPDLDERFLLPTTVWLVASAGEDDAGSPCLIVTLIEETCPR